MMGCAAAIASAQPTQVGMEITIEGIAYGKPGNVDLATFSGKVGQIVVNGTALPFDFIEFLGSPTLSKLHFTSTVNANGGAAGDYFVFENSTFTPINGGLGGRTGTLNLYAASGPFSGGTVTLEYSFTCDNGCATALLGAKYGDFHATFSARGGGQFPAAIKFTQGAAPTAILPKNPPGNTKGATAEDYRATAGVTSLSAGG